MHTLVTLAAEVRARAFLTWSFTWFARGITFIEVEPRFALIAEAGKGVTFSAILVTPLTFTLINTKSDATLCTGGLVGALFTNDLIWIAITVLTSRYIKYKVSCDALVALLWSQNRTVITFVNLACGINALILGAIKPEVSGALLTNSRINVTTLGTIRNRASRVSCAFLRG